MTHRLSAGGIRLRLVGLALLAVLPLVALGIHRLTANRRHERAMLFEEVARAASISAARLDEQIQSADALLLGLAESMHANARLRTANEAVLVRTLKNAPPMVSNLFLLDTSGTLVGTARKVGPSGDSVRAFVDRAYFNIARTSRSLIVGERRVSAVLSDHPWVVVLARAITDSAGRFMGVVSAPVRLDSLVLGARTEVRAHKTLVTIFDTSGMIVARSEGTDSLIGRRRAGGRIRIDTSGTMTTPGIDGVIRFSGFTYTRSAPWMITAGVPETVLKARLSESVRDELLLFLLALTLAVLMAAYVGQRITQPIGALVEAARAFERGENGRPRYHARSQRNPGAGQCIQPDGGNRRAPHRSPRGQ